MHGGTSQAGELGHHTQPGTSSPHLTWNIQTTGFWPSTVTPVSPASASSMRHLQGKSDGSVQFLGCGHCHWRVEGRCGS